LYLFYLKFQIYNTIIPDFDMTKESSDGGRKKRIDLYIFLEDEQKYSNGLKVMDIN